MTPESKTTDSAAGLRQFLQTVRRRWVVIASCALALAGASLAISLSKTNEYSAAASLLFREDNLDQELFGNASLAPSSDPVREAATNLTLVSLGTVAERTAQTLGGGLTPGYVAAAVGVSANGQSNVVAVTATDPDPVRAARLANVYALQYIQFRIQADRSKIQQALRLIENQSKTAAGGSGAQARRLLAQRERLKVFEALQTGNAELVQRAQPPGSPSSPQPRRDAVIGGVLGLLLGLVTAVVLERLDRRIRDISMLEEELGLIVLAAIPESRSLSIEPAVGMQPGAEMEAFHMLRARLRYFNVDRDIRTVLVASSASGDGKSTVALHLTVATAGAAETKVLLIECDMRLPTLAAQLHAKQNPGLSELISQHNLTLADVVQSISLGSGRADDGVHSFDYIPAGAVPPNPLELIASKRMAAILHEARDKYDLVVLDTPPTSVVSDSFPMLQQVDGVIIVARLNHSTRDGVARLNDTMVHLNAPVLGVVVNAMKSSSFGYGYGYGYGYGAYHDQNGASPSADPDTPDAAVVGASEPLRP